MSGWRKKQIKECEMTQDEIIEMADKADEEAEKVLNMKGEYHPNWHQVRDEIFAKLVAAKAFQNGYEKGVAAFNDAVLIEREACAKVCEDKNTLLAWPTYAAAIRARGEQA
jgi:hypothetical protein